MNFTLGFIITYMYYFIALFGASYIKNGGDVWTEIFLKQMVYGFFVTC